MVDYEAPLVNGRVEPSPRAAALLLESPTIAARAFLMSDDGSTRTPLPLLTGGSVTADAKSIVRRSASLNVLGAWVDSSSTRLAPYGARVQVQRGVRVATDAVEWMTLMTGPVWESEQDDDEAGPGPLSLPLRDEMAMVERTEVDPGASTDDTATVVAEITRLIREALPAATVIDRTGSTVLAAKFAIQNGRGGAIEKLATSIGADCYAGREWQTFYIDLTPALSDPPRWCLEVGARSNVATVNRKRTAESVFNRVLAIGKAPTVDGQTSQAPDPWAIAEITDAADPLWVGGPFGRSTRKYERPELDTVEKCRTAAATVLERIRGAAEDFSFTALVNPAAEPGDVFSSALTDRIPRTHIADSLNYPLGDADLQAVSCRSRDLPEETVTA